MAVTNDTIFGSLPACLFATLFEEKKRVYEEKCIDGNKLRFYLKSS